MSEILDLLIQLSPLLLYLFLALGAALENVVPPVPADTFVLLGGFLVAAGDANAWTVFWVTWGGNVASALAMYGAGHRYGRPVFDSGLGRYLLNRRQMERLDRFYRRWGRPAIFFSRFLPGLRAAVPVFAGVTRQSFWSVAVPVAAASAIWYGVLVRVGIAAGRNLDVIVELVSGVNRVLLLVATLLAVGIGVWWWRTRHPPEDR